jgi:Patatin-like phospholipase
LSVLLRELKDQVRVIVGTSAGALISAYLVANWHRPAEEAIEDGLSFWREMRFGDVFAALMAPSGAARFMRYVGEFLPVSSLHAPSILHPEPLAQTLGRLVDFDQLHENVREQRVALGVVATPAHGNGSVVFHEGGIPRHPDDPLRGIEYVGTPNLRPEHILASSAIPTSSTSISRAITSWPRATTSPGARSSIQRCSDRDASIAGSPFSHRTESDGCRSSRSTLGPSRWPPASIWKRSRARPRHGRR